eukprot:4865264-Amphidinium_carterae.2
MKEVGHQSGPSGFHFQQPILTLALYPHYVPFQKCFVPSGVKIDMLQKGTITYWGSWKRDLQHLMSTLGRSKTIFVLHAPGRC